MNLGKMLLLRNGRWRNMMKGKEERKLRKKKGKEYGKDTVKEEEKKVVMLIFEKLKREEYVEKEGRKE